MGEMQMQALSCYTNNLPMLLSCLLKLLLITQVTHIDQPLLGIWKDPGGTPIIPRAWMATSLLPVLCPVL